MVCSNFLACHNEQNFYENLSEISTFYKTGNISSLLARGYTYRKSVPLTANGSIAGTIRYEGTAM